MSTGQSESRKPTHEPKKSKVGEKGEAVELQVEELEERIAPAKMY